MSRVHNFSAGPAALPEPVLEAVREELLDWNGQGASVMELSHRGKAFVACAEQAEADLRELLKVPDSHAVLFLQGGATLQFSMLAMNLAGPDDVADYVLTGHWGLKAQREAAMLLRTRLAADASAEGFRHAPAPAEWDTDPDAAYLHYTPNETIHGVEYFEVPDSGEVPLVADCSSMLLSRPLPVARFGLIYAGAQKNIGPAGLTLVIVRRELLERRPRSLPGMLSYAAHAAQGSMLNTPPTFAWYLAGRVFAWLLEQGGLEAMAERNRRKAERLYACIDASGFYSNPVERAARSRMNVPFFIAERSLEPVFVAEAEAAGLIGLKGHRALGGLRASLYNAVSEAAVDALVEFMRDFEARYG